MAWRTAIGPLRAIVVGDVQRPRARLAGRDHVVHEPGRLRLVGVHPPPREDQLLGEGRAQEAGQELGAADAREDAERRLGNPEHGRLAGHDEVGQDGQLAPSGQREALDGGDDGHRAAQHAQSRLLEDDVLGTPGLVGHLVALLEVAPRAERAVPGAREDHGSHVAVPREAVEAGEQVLAHRGVHRIHLVGAVERHRHHVTVRGARDEQMAVRGHATSPCVRSVRTSSSV